VKLESEGAVRRKEKEQKKKKNFLLLSFSLFVQDLEKEGKQEAKRMLRVVDSLGRTLGPCGVFETPVERRRRHLSLWLASFNLFVDAIMFPILIPTVSGGPFFGQLCVEETLRSCSMVVLLFFCSAIVFLSDCEWESCGAARWDPTRDTPG